jgi:hypothetical protein
VVLVRALAFLPLFFVAGLGVRYAFSNRPAMTATDGAIVAIEEKIPEEGASLTDGGSTDAKAQRLVAAALRKSAALDRESELYLAIQAFTADDFRKLLLDPGALKTMAEKLKTADWRTSRNLISGLITRLLAVDPDSIASWAPRVLELIPKKQNIRAHFLDELAAKRPEQMLAMAASRKEPSERAEIISRALRELASKNLTKAQVWLKDCTDPADRLVAEKAIRLGMVEADPLRAIELASAIDSRQEGFAIINAATQRARKMGPGVLRQLATMPMKAWMLSAVLGEFSERDPELAVDLALKSPSEADSDAQAFSLQSAFSSLSRKDPSHAISKLDGITGAHQRAAAISSIGEEWASRDPAAALSWLAEKSVAERTNSHRYGYGTNDSLLIAFGDWVGSNRSDAQAWANALPTGEMRDKMQAQLARVLAARGDTAAATQILFATGRAADPKALSDIARSWARDDPQAAADWAIAQPAGLLQSRALASVVGTWANDNPNAAQDWLAQFPPGETRDRSIGAFLSRPSSWTNNTETQIAEFDAWFDRIDDPWQRAQAATRSFWSRKQSDPQGARRWLLNLPNVDTGFIHMTLSYDN